ncbi:CRTAC1 family protein [Candidatus Poribacteria bacterium]|nr:CRTAC1 family protein [Candidatus Poribacteria bacterium]
MERKLQHWSLLILNLFLPLCHAQNAVQFLDVTAKAGIVFKHVNGASDHKFYLETMGSGAAFLDYDNDGDLDLYIVNGAALPGFETPTPPTNNLYRNNGEDKFTNVTAVAGVGDTGYGMGCVAADYDNDGDSDLYVTNFGTNLLYQNNGDGTFTDATAHAGVGNGQKWSASCAFVDYDHDGNLDLYVVNYLDYDVAEDRDWYDPRGRRIYSNPQVYKGVSDTLYRNNGDGTFTDVTRQAGVYNDNGKGLGVTCGDYDNDGRIDIYVANDTTPNFLYRNVGDGRFVDIGPFAGAAYNEHGVAEGGMGVDFGDYNNDGALDIFVTNFSNETNTLYHNTADGALIDFTNIAGLGEASFLKLAFGTKFFDADNDGTLDIFVANGHLYPTESDALEYAQTAQLFINTGEGTFVDASEGSGEYFTTKRVGRGVSLGDYDNDGDTDIFVVNLNQEGVLLRNEGGKEHNWLMIKTVGVKSNRDGIGARVEVVTRSHSQMKEVQAGSSYLSGHDLRLLFGLGTETKIESIKITWPSGVEQILENAEVNQLLIVTEKN